MNIPFNPVYGTEKTIQALSLRAGYVYFTTDSGKILFDATQPNGEIKRIVLGHSGSAIYYALANDLTMNANNTYTILQSQLEDRSAALKKDDLIINVKGQFLKVQEFYPNDPNPHAICKLVSVSGTSSSGPSSGTTDPRAITVEFEPISSYSFLAGTSFDIGFVATAPDSRITSMTASYTVQNMAGKIIDQGSKTITSGERVVFENIGKNMAPDGISNLIIISVRALNCTPFEEYIPDVKCVNLKVARDPQFNSTQIYAGNRLTYSVYVYGQIDKQLHVEVDGEPINESPIFLSANVHNANKPITIQCNNYEPGVHTITTYLEADGVKSNKLNTDFVYHPAGTPDTTYIVIIDYPQSCLSYETPAITYWVYNTKNPDKNEITFSVNGNAFTDTLDQTTTASVWEVQGLLPDEENKCEIYCGDSAHSQVIIYCKKSPIFDEISDGFQYVLLNAEGRTNNTSLERRLNWSYFNGDNTIKAKLSNFTWGDVNGWVKDDKQRSCLRISNGASVEIPLNLFPEVDEDKGEVVTGGYTFDIEFKPYNLYSYKLLTQDTQTDGEDETVVVTKSFDIREASITYASNLTQNGFGLGCGTQDAFFNLSNGESVSVRYENDKIINLSVVINATEKRLYMYINGVLSGASTYTASNGRFPMPSGNSDLSLIFNSQYCDIDLYNVRVYKEALSSQEVVQNYIASKKDLVLATQNALVSGSDLSYTAIEQYNKNNPLNMTIPYIVFRSKSKPYMPYNKEKDPIICDVTFVNPALDAAFKNKELNMTIDDYKSHAPSFFAQDVSINVQGTSSQKYPRKNFKGKFKDSFKAGKVTCLNSEIPEAQKTLSNFTIRPGISEKTFTWKADYMDSSSAHNTGFASYVYELYSKHPLDYYGLNSDTSYFHKKYRTTLFGFPVLAFHETDNQEPQFIGIYNFNLDKGADDTLGMSYSGKQENVEVVYEYKDGEVISITDPDKITFDKVCECWEMANNSGGRCSFRGADFNNNYDYDRHNYYKDADTVGLSDIGEDIEVRYHWCGDAIEGAWENLKEPVEGRPIVDSDRITGEQAFNVLLGGNEAGENKTGAYKNLEILYQWLNECYYAFNLDDPEDVQWIKTLALNKKDQLSATISAETLKSYYSTYSSKKNENLLNTIISSGIVTGQDHEKIIALNAHAQNIIDAGGLLKSKGEYEIKKYKQQNGDTIGSTTYDYINILISEEEYCNLINELFSYYTDNDLKDKVFSRDGILYKENGFPIDYFCFQVEKERQSKFENEFDKHLNKDYCLMYYLLTELFLCFDSRGKNMMLSSWGPVEEFQKDKNGDFILDDDGEKIPGEYIWFPIFYDVDTQLGVNNSGIPSWEYNVEPSTGFNNDGTLTFSTPNSLLWRNFHRSFAELNPTDLQSLYKGLRTNRLSQDAVQKYYSLSGRAITDTDYCFKGILPISIFNANEEYKYIQPHTTGYLSGGVEEAEPTVKYTQAYLYCLQGTRDSYRAQFLRNRFNYYDSKFQAGNYAPAAGGAQDFWRINATPLGSDVQAKPEFTITPALDQYVSVWPDDNTTTPVFSKGGQAVTIDLSPYLSGANYNQQIVRIGGIDSYIQSIGDTSALYPEEFIYPGNKFVDMILGNDSEGYVQNDGFSLTHLTAAIDDNNPKPLLKVFDITNISKISSISLPSSAKLQEFKALGTSLTEVTFANGAPLKKIFLPATITGLSLQEAKFLTKIIDDSKTGVIPEGKTNPAEEGLYIQDLFTGDNDCNIAKIDFRNVEMKQDSYVLLNQLMNRRGNKELKINMTGVQWSPYIKLGEGAAKESDESYYLATDNHTFIIYNDSEELSPWMTEENWHTKYNAEQRWNKLVASGRVYRKEKDVNSVVQNFALLNALKDKSNFIGLSNAAVPTVSGTIFVNDSSLSEQEIFNYRNSFPELDIRVPEVKSSCARARFVLVQDGVETEIYVTKGAVGDNIYLPNNITMPQVLEKVFDFWSLDFEGKNKVTPQTEEGNLLSKKYGAFTDKPKVYYAQYKSTSFKVEFIDINTVAGEEAFSDSKTITIGDRISLPNKIPSRPVQEADLFAGNSTTKVPIPQRIDFRGWTSKQDRCQVYDSVDIADPLVEKNLTSIEVDREYTFYPIYAKVSAFSKPAQLSGFKFERHSSNQGWTVSAKENAEFKGRITIPAKYEEEPVIALKDFSSLQGVQYIFFEEGSEIKEVLDDCFIVETEPSEEKHLWGVFFPDSLSFIGENAFKAQEWLRHLSNKVYDPVEPRIGYLSDNITEIGYSAFQARINQRGKFQIQNLPNNLVKLGQYAFSKAGAGVTFSTIPTNSLLTEIPLHAFSYCGVTITDIPANIKVIGGSAFRQIAGSDVPSDKVRASEGNIFSKDCSIGDYAFDNYRIGQLNYYTDRDWTDEEKTKLAGKIGVTIINTI